MKELVHEIWPLLIVLDLSCIGMLHDGMQHLLASG